MTNPANDLPTPRHQQVLRQLLDQHSGLTLTALYLFLIGIGMMYEWWLFFRFGVNILYYAEATDFLLVPFREPLVVLVSLTPIPLYAAYIRVASWLGRKSRLARRFEAAPGSRTHRLRPYLNALAIALWSFAFTAEYASWVADGIRAGGRKTAALELTAANGVTPARVNGPIIGTTAKFVFVYDPSSKQTRIINLGSVAEIVVAPRKPRRR